MSIDLASLISSSDCIYVQNAYQIYDFNYTFKKTTVYMFSKFLKLVKTQRLDECKKHSKINERQTS